PFGAAAFAGFVLALFLLAAALRNPRRGELVPLLAFTLALVIVHSLTHTEGRYSFSAVPGALLSLCWLSGGAGMTAGRRRAIRAAAVLLAAVFLAQTALWDHSDAVLQSIESAFR